MNEWSSSASYTDNYERQQGKHPKDAPLLTSLPGGCVSELGVDRSRSTHRGGGDQGQGDRAGRRALGRGLRPLTRDTVWGRMLVRGRPAVVTRRKDEEETMGRLTSTAVPCPKCGIKYEINATMCSNSVNQNIVSVLPALCTKGQNHASDDFTAWPDQGYLLLWSQRYSFYRPSSSARCHKGYSKSLDDLRVRMSIYPMQHFWVQ